MTPPAAKAANPKSSGLDVNVTNTTMVLNRLSRRTCFGGGLLTVLS